MTFAGMFTVIQFIVTTNQKLPKVLISSRIILIYSHVGILYRNEKERSTKYSSVVCTLSSGDESHECSAGSSLKDHLLCCVLVCVKCEAGPTLSCRKSMQCLWGRGQGVLTGRREEGASGAPSFYFLMQVHSVCENSS